MAYFSESNTGRRQHVLAMEGQTNVQSMSALPPIADIGTQSCDVRFVPKADISLLPDGTLSRTVYRHLEGAILIHAEQVSRIVALLGAVNSGLANRKHQLVIP